MEIMGYYVGINYSDNSNEDNLLKINDIGAKYHKFCVGIPSVTLQGRKEWGFQKDNKKGALEFLSEVLDLEFVKNATIVAGRF